MKVMSKEWIDMSEKEVKNRWIILFIIAAILSLIGVSALTLILQKILVG
jgi:hypothetical protein